jgi:hypothetical protein
MIKMAKKFNTNLTVIRLIPQLSAQLLAWYHLSAEPRAINTAVARCHWIYIGRLGNANIWTAP